MFLLEQDARVHRRLRAGRLQRDALGPVAVGRHVLLSEPAAVARPAPAQPVVRVRVLPEQPAAVHAVDPGHAYAVAGDEVFVNLYVQGPARIKTRRARSRSSSAPTTRGTATSASRECRPPAGRSRSCAGAGLGARAARAGRPLPAPGARAEGGVTLSVNGWLQPSCSRKGYAGLSRAGAAGDHVRAASADARPPRRRAPVGEGRRGPGRHRARAAGLRRRVRRQRRARDQSRAAPTRRRSPRGAARPAGRRDRRHGNGDGVPHAAGADAYRSRYR